MQTVHYGQSTFDTDDAIASAVLAYAEVLATRRRFAVVDIPTVTALGVKTMQMLIGPGIPLASSTRLDDFQPPPAAPRDEFGSGGRPTADGIGELDVRRTVRTLQEGAARVRHRVFATPLDDEPLMGDFREQDEA
jgi:hypothetical protein